jgi:signal peptidase
MTMRLRKDAFTKAVPIFMTILVVSAMLAGASGLYRKFVYGEKIPLIAGIGSAVVITGSMEPAVNAGDLVIIRQQSSYQVGDIVAYEESTPVTHRIVQVTEDGFVTKGDANNTTDDEVAREEVIGSVVATVPSVGHAILYLQTPVGMIVLLCGLFIVYELSRIFERRDEDVRAGDVQVVL